MKISLNWLKDYITPGISSEKLIHKLTMAGLEVEKEESIGNDTVFELEITPNRPDCLSMLGIAREISAILNKKCEFPKIKKRAWPKKKCAIDVQDKISCSRYIGTVIENVSIKNAQEKIIKRLSSLEMRPINNIVDITNFCLLETGQPLHAFDYDKIEGKKIIVRRARKGEKIVTIDGIERALDPSILIIADEKRPVAIAGIMGGIGTEVTKTTKNILLESAYFDSILIRRASRKLGLSSDSSYRFERGVDFGMVEGGAGRAIDLILESAGGTITNRSDAVTRKKGAAKKQISISIEHINNYIGASLTSAQCRNILKKLDFKIAEGKKEAFKIMAPSFRNDIKEPVDIIEEIARIIGYDNLPLSTPQIKPSQIISNPKRGIRTKIRELFIAQGFIEAITYTMINRKMLENCHQEDLPTVDIFNPLTQDQEIMRPSMLPSLLTVIRSNINRGQKDLKIFEIGKIYTKKGEQEVAGVIMTGRVRNDWREMDKKISDFYDLKGAVEHILNRIGILNAKMNFIPEQGSCFTSGCSAHLMIDGKQVGVVGQIKDSALNKSNIKQKNIYFAQIDLDSIYSKIPQRRKYKPASEFPVINRDISLAVSTEISARDIELSIRSTARDEGGVVLSDVKFIELYEGEKIAKGSRGLIFSLTYQSRLEKTLRDEEAELVHKKVCAALIKDLGVTQR